MNRRQQKHDMMIMFLLHAKAKKQRPQKPALINTTELKNFLVSTIPKTVTALKEKLLGQHILHGYLHERWKYSFMSLLKNKRV